MKKKRIYVEGVPEAVFQMSDVKPDGTEVKTFEVWINGESRPLSCKIESTKKFKNQFAKLNGLIPNDFLEKELEAIAHVEIRAEMPVLREKYGTD